MTHHVANFYSTFVWFEGDPFKDLSHNKIEICNLKLHTLVLRFTPWYLNNSRRRSVSNLIWVQNIFRIYLFTFSCTTLQTIPHTCLTRKLSRKLSRKVHPRFFRCISKIKCLFIIVHRFQVAPQVRKHHFL